MILQHQHYLYLKHNFDDTPAVLISESKEERDRSIELTMTSGKMNHLTLMTILNIDY
jgi:hypothetical protein